MLATFGDQIYFWLFPQIVGQKEALSVGAMVMMYVIFEIKLAFSLHTKIDVTLNFLVSPWWHF